MSDKNFSKILPSLFLIIFFVGTGSGILGSALFLHYSGRTNAISSSASIFPLKAEEKNVVDVVKETNPAVVSIVISKKVSASSPEADIFENFFGFPFRISQPSVNTSPSSTQSDLRRVGGGSGFLIGSEGLVVTNKHVVADENAVYTIVMNDEKEFSATVVARDPVLDVALLKIENKEGKKFPTLTLGDSDQLQIGQTVIAIGYALAEFGNTVTKGVVSGVGRHVVARDTFGQREILEEAIQTDSAINPGNSGGPLLDLSGKVIGVNTAVSQEGQLVGFAIPINTLKKSIESVQKNGRIIRPWLGVRYIPVTPLVAQENSLPVKYGAWIQSNENETAVVEGSPAAKAGVQKGDIILEINGKKLEDKDSLPKEISVLNVGQEISVKIMRNGKEKTLQIKLEEFPNQ